MAKCNMCGKWGIFLKVNKYGRCENCENKVQEEWRRIAREKQQEKERKKQEELRLKQERKEQAERAKKLEYHPEPFKAKIDDWYLKYRYTHVRTNIDQEKFYRGFVTLQPDGDAVYIIIDNANIGKIIDEQKAQMIIDFSSRKELIIAQMDSPASICIGFYKKILEGIENAEYEIYRIIKTSKKDELFETKRYENIEYMKDEEVVSLIYQDETSNYLVYNLRGEELGELARSDSKKIITRAETSDAVAVITDIDYDEKEKPTAKIKVYFK